MHILGATFPISAGLLLFGWRAAGLIAVVVTTTVAALLVWQRIGRRGAQLRLDYGVWLGLLLSLTLPAELFSRASSGDGNGVALWPILPAAGLTLAALMWLLGGLGAGRIHPVLVTTLLIFVLFRQAIVPHLTLQHDRLFTGDLLDAPETTRDAREAWLHLQSDPAHAAVRAEPASQRLIFFTTGTQAPARLSISLESLLRDSMPPLEDMIVGGQPAPIGTSSAIAVIIGGLFLLYRGLIDYRVPLFMVLSAYAAFLVLPVPVVLTELATDFRWLVWRTPPAGAGWTLGLTLANYELMASPLLFTAFFLATSPAVRPMARRARVIFAVVTGLLAAAFQLYVAVSIGPYLALLATSLLTPFLDRLFRTRTLV